MRRRSNAARQRTPAAALAVAACLAGVAALATSCGGRGGRGGLAHGKAAAWQFGTLAGYVAPAPMSSISGAWPVPGVEAHSPDGIAASWIGAQASFGPSAFIQVGTNESLLDGRTDYYAFWSDRTHAFRPQRLFAVSAADVVDASLRLEDGLWHVSIEDPAAHRRASFTTAQEAAGAFELAEWLQEDPGGKGRPVPYPHMQPTSFSELRLNGSPPLRSQLLSQWLTADGGYIGPGSLAQGAFTIAARTLDVPARNYLHLAAPLDRAILAFDEAAQSWSAATSPAQLRRGGAVVAGALERFLVGIGAGTWPAPSKGRIGELVSGLHDELEILRSPPHRAGPQWRDWVVRIEAADAHVHEVTQRLREQLDLPQLFAVERGEG